MGAVAAGLATALSLSLATVAGASPPAQQGGGEAVQAPALNHLYIVVDARTFAAVRDSAELADILGRADGGLPDYAPPPPEADRIFFRGRETYLEFFSPDNRFGEPVGKVGLAIGHDSPAPFDALETAWAAACGDRKRRTAVSFTRIEPPVAWYDAVQCDDTAAGPQLALWAMVYRPEFHRWQTGDDPANPPRTSRADILGPRQGDGQGRFNVTGLSVDLDAELAIRLAAQLRQAGFVQEYDIDGIRLMGPDFTIRLRQANEPDRKIAIELDTKLPPAVFLRLGRGHLEMSDGVAVLEFALPSDVAGGNASR